MAENIKKDIVKSLNCKLFYGVDEATTEVLNLQEIGELGGTSESIEITTLADEAHTYTAGLKSFGDSIAFKALYTKEQFMALDAVKESVNWKVELADGTVCTFTGTCSVSVDAIGVNQVLTYTLSVKPDSAMAFA